MYASQAREFSEKKYEYQELIDDIKVRIVIAVIYKKKEIKIDIAYLPKEVIEYFKDLEYRFRKGRSCYIINWH